MQVKALTTQLTSEQKKSYTKKFKKWVLYTLWLNFKWYLCCHKASDTKYLFN